MDREQIRTIIVEITAYKVATQFSRNNDGTVSLLVPGGPTDEQLFLLHRWNRHIYQYLVTPPAVQGECWRGHPIRWVCTSYGIWLCVCYYECMRKINYQTIIQGRVAQ